MIEQHQHDLYYLKARHGERLREIAPDPRKEPTGLSELKELALSFAGNVLIDWGLKLKGDVETRDLMSDCA